MKSVFLDDSGVNITPENERVKALSVRVPGSFVFLYKMI